VIDPDKILIELAHVSELAPVKETHDWSAFDLYLHTRHRCSRADVEPTDTPGYWRHKAACGGKKGGCREPIHQTLFNDGPVQHTIQFLDKTERYKGRWRGRLTADTRAVELHDKRS